MHAEIQMVAAEVEARSLPWFAMILSWVHDTVITEAREGLVLSLFFIRFLDYPSIVRCAIIVLTEDTAVVFLAKQ